MPPGLAELLDFIQATYVEEVDYDAADNRFVVKRPTTSGEEVISIPKPAVLSIELGVNSPIFPDFALKKELDSNYKLTIWDNKEFNFDLEVIDLHGSLTIVDVMVHGKTRERKKIFLDGSSDEIVLFRDHSFYTRYTPKSTLSWDDHSER